MGRLPAGLLAELQKTTPHVQQWLDLGPLPDGTTWRISTAATSLAMTGPGDPVVLRWGTLKEAVDPFSADPAPMELNFAITDEGDPGGNNRRRFARLAAKYPRTLRRTPAVLTWSGGGATYARFTGVLVNYAQTGPMQWQLTCRTDDSAINGDAGASVPKASRATYFPSTPDDFKKHYASIIFGTHDSNGLGNEGLIPCYPVDTLRFRFDVGTGALTVPAVYEDGVIVNTADYTITKETIGGALWTLINFTNNRAEGTVITADVDGLTDVVDGSGALLINASGILKFLVWFAWGDFRGGAYPANTTAPVYVPSFTALDTFLARSGHERSQFLGGPTQQKAAEVLRADLDSILASGYWRHDGLFAVGVLDPIPPSDIYAISYHFEVQDEQGEFGTPNDESNIAREVSVEYAPNASTGELMLKARFMDVRVPEKVVVTLALTNSGARIVP